MDVKNLFLGRPWQSIHRVLLDAYINTSVFTYPGKHVNFLPLPICEVSQDQVTRTTAQELNVYNNALKPEGHTFDPGDLSLRHQVGSANSAYTIITRCNMPANTALQEHCHQKELHQQNEDAFHQQALLDLTHLQELLAYEADNCDAAALHDGTTLSLSTRHNLNVKDSEFIDQRVRSSITRCMVKNAKLSFLHSGGRCCNIFTKKAVTYLSLSTRPPPQPNGLQRIASTGNTVSRQCLFQLSFVYSMCPNLSIELAVEVTTLLLGRPRQFHRVLHVAYLSGGG